VALGATIDELEHWENNWNKKDEEWLEFTVVQKTIVLPAEAP
jgi:hypothetical protein